MIEAPCELSVRYVEMEIDDRYLINMLVAEYILVENKSVQAIRPIPLWPRDVAHGSSLPCFAPSP